MKHSERFERAVSALVDAFYKGTLKKGLCTACAVGNICNGSTHWGSVFQTCGKIQSFDWNYYKGIPKEIIDNTGHSVEQLAKIEYAFETNAFINFRLYSNYTEDEIIEDQYRGLMSVVEVLCEIEGIKPEPTKELFSAKPEICRV